MAARSELRKEAYKFVLQILGDISSSSDNADWNQCIPLDELRLLKEGMEDPSPNLVSLLKELLQGAVSESVIDAHLVIPFKDYAPDKG